MKLIIHDVGDDYEHFGVHSKRTRRSVYVVNDNGREIARFSIYNLNRPISAYPEEIEIAKRFMASEAAEVARDAQFETNVRLLQENIELRARAAQLEADHKNDIENLRHYMDLVDSLEAERDELARQLAEARNWARVWKSAAKWRRLGAAITFK